MGNKPNQVEVDIARRWANEYIETSPLSYTAEKLKTLLLALDNAKDEVGTLDKELDEEKSWRREMWLNHGCPISHLYGDDGEMCCNQCMIDFKRATIKNIAIALVSKRPALAIDRGDRKHD